MACVSIQLLSSDDIDEAYVLARLCDFGLTLKAWRAKVVTRQASPAAGGVLVARNLEATPCGLLVYALADQPDGRRSLQIEQLVGFDILDPRRVTAALITEVVRLSRASGCETLCLMQPLGECQEVAAQILATGMAVLPSLLWSVPHTDGPPPPFDLGQGRRPAGLIN